MSRRSPLTEELEGWSVQPISDEIGIGGDSGLQRYVYIDGGA